MIENKKDILIAEISYKSDVYRQELELRDRVLRIPLGMSLYDEVLDAEQQDVHIGAFIEGTLAGVLILTKLTPTDIKMRQVAVDIAVQRGKIGTELVLYAEEYSKKNGFATMVLHARKTAVGFYEKMGYETIGEEFLEINIPHFKMRKRL